METISRYLKSAEAWLDARGPGAWLVAMILGFIFVWPVGLALLFYMLWSNKMTRHSCRSKPWARPTNRFEPTGNAAFDAYREETLKRLEDEQAAFQGFMEKLRKAKDQAEFDQFMDDRRRKPAAPASDAGDFDNGAPMPA